MSPFHEYGRQLTRRDPGPHIVDEGAYRRQDRLAAVLCQQGRQGLPAEHAVDGGGAMGGEAARHDGRDRGSGVRALG